jgi:hypothetical protein
MTASPACAVLEHLTGEITEELGWLRQAPYFMRERFETWDQVVRVRGERRTGCA